MDRRHSLAAKGAVALLADQREPRAPRLSRRRARITPLALKGRIDRELALKRRGEQISGYKRLTEAQRAANPA